MFLMKESWRWYGPNDPISLDFIRQAGVTDIVHALHHIPNGEVWPVDEIQARQKMIADKGLMWSVVESVPVHEHIKTQTGDFQKYIDNYKLSLRNLAACGIRCVTYNFMPVLDWTRTDLAYEMSDGSRGLRFERAAYMAFDLFILKRKGAEKEYTQTEIARAEDRYRQMDDAEKDLITRNMIAGLPGSEESFTLEQFREALARYDGIDEDRLRDNLVYFLKEICPVADECGVEMVIHPDDPPLEGLRGMPRLVYQPGLYQKVLDLNPSPANKLEFCMGSIQEMTEGDIYQAIQQYGGAGKISYCHFRNVKGKIPKYDEVFVDEGDIDMLKALDLLEKCGFDGVISPDHTPEIDCKAPWHAGMAYALGYMRAAMQQMERRN